LGSDKRTVLAELLGRDGLANSLIPEGLALAKSSSITIRALQWQAVLEFLEWTEGDRLRDSKFIALRDDKGPT